LKRISALPLAARSLSESLWPGGFASIYRGQGIEVDEVRRYEIGDDVRSIDWNVSARFGSAYVKVYREEREMSAALVLDTSLSMRCNSGSVSSFDQSVIAFALVAYSAEVAGQSVGALFFDRDIRRIFPPWKGKAHTLALLGAALEARQGEKVQGTGLGKALTGIGRLFKRRSLVVIISDFMCTAWEHELGELCRHHDVIAIKISSPLEKELPRIGLVSLRDPETDREFAAPLGLGSFRLSWASWQEERLTVWKGICTRYGAAACNLSTTQDAAEVLFRFFESYAGQGRGKGRR
jgi:uncharacterized protein (DUF58 family)